MNADFDPAHLPAEFYASKIESLKERVSELDAQIADLEKLRQERTEAAKELEFWSLGYQLFVGPQEQAMPITARGGASATANGGGTVFPVGDRPPLREAIKIIMREGDRDGWRARDLYEALKERGWEPGGKVPTDAIGAMLAGMRKNREVFWVDRGVYSITPPAQLVPDERPDE